MHEAIERMLAKYDLERTEDYVRALREILQEIALLGLWRSRFFEKAAFYGGTALRILYDLDRFSEDLDFSLRSPLPDFELARYNGALQRELQAFGFDVEVEERPKSIQTQIQSTFLKVDTIRELVHIKSDERLTKEIPPGQILKIKVEVDTDPPPGFETETKYLLSPIPFSVRSYRLSDLFAGKMHAVLCRQWKSRVKGRDWYDLVWFAANHPALHLSHLEQRMRQTGHWKGNEILTVDEFMELAERSVNQLDVQQARREVERFVRDPNTLSLWSRSFFRDVISRVEFV